MSTTRDIPSIEQLRQRPSLRLLESRYGRAAIVEALRAAAAAMRTLLAEGTAPPDPGAAIEAALPARLAAAQAPSLLPVINATGVIVHTNLGRAPLCDAAIRRVAALAAGYTNLEYDVAGGERGQRDVHAQRLLCHLSGAEAAVVVNNNAAATLLVLAALGAGREVLIARGELIEIGGGFRVPDVMAQSGVRLREVGTTNRTRIADYAAAISDRTALIMRVHPSNFRIEGFTERPPLDALVALGRRFNLPVVEDQGSGYLGLGPEVPALRDEPTVRDSVAAGAGAVLFSGDKLLGGPQAGIVVGTAAALATVRRHPLMRALRVDKMTCAALEATLGEFAAGRAMETVPVAMMIALSPESIGSRAEALATGLDGAGLTASVIDGHSTIGGGSAPGSVLPTRLLALHSGTLSASALVTRLRHQQPAVIARIEDDRVVLDLRTVRPDQEQALATIIRAATLPSSA